MDNDLLIQLEQLMDTYGLPAILDALAEVSREKAEHVRSTWQDYALARMQDKNARLLETTATRVEHL